MSTYVGGQIDDRGRFLFAETSGRMVDELLTFFSLIFRASCTLTERPSLLPAGSQIPKKIQFGTRNPLMS